MNRRYDAGSMLWVVAVLCGWFSCPLHAQEPVKSDPIPVVVLDRKDPVSFRKEIRPIFVNKCLTCHSGPITKGDLDLSSHASLLEGGKRGKILIPGKPSESLLVKFTGKIEKPFMPPPKEDPLTPQELALIKLWISQGAKSDETGTLPAVTIRPLAPTVQMIRSVVISPDKALVLAARGNTIHVHATESGKSILQLSAHAALVEALALSPDGQTLASGSFREVFLWNVKDGTLQRKLTGFADRVVALAFSPDGKVLATGGGRATVQGEIKVFEPSTGKLVLDIKDGHSDTVFGVCFSPDGKMLATGGADLSIKVFSLADGKLIKRLDGHGHHVLAVAWQHDGKVLASAGADSKVRLWDFKTGEQLTRINRGGGQITTMLCDHDQPVSAVCFVGTTSQLLSCGGDQPARLWRLEEVTKASNYYTPYIQPRSVRTFGDGKDYLYAISASADGSLVATGGESGIVRLHDGVKGTLLKELPP